MKIYFAWIVLVGVMHFLSNPTHSFKGTVVTMLVIITVTLVHMYYELYQLNKVK
jgi:hypothetical protein